MSEGNAASAAAVGSGGNVSNTTSTAAANLEAMIARKQQLDDDLRVVERTVIESEEAYLEDTHTYGNVYRGWDGFLTSRPPRPPGSHHHHATKRSQIALKERIFSLSSVTAPLAEAFGHEAIEEYDSSFGMPLTFRGDSMTNMSTPMRLSQQGRKQTKQEDEDE